MTKKLAIIGASYLQLPAYIKAKELGIDTIGFAWDEGAIAKEHCSKFYPISTIEKGKILHICRSEKIDGVLTLATDIAVPTVSYVAEEMGLIGNSTYSALLCTNKFLMRQAFDNVGLHCPKYFQIGTLQELDLYRNGLEFPLIVKPVDRSGSRGVKKVYDFSQLVKAAEISLNESLCNQAIVEVFIEGVEVSVEVISFNSTHFPLTITDKVTSGCPHYVELEHHQPSGLPIDIQNYVFSETIKALDALNVRFGASHSEFIIANGKVYVTEVGARMGGDFIGSDLVFLSTGYDFLKGIIEVSLNNFDKPEKKWEKNAGVFFYSIESLKVGEIIKEKLLNKIVIKSEITSEDLKPLQKSSDRSGYFIYQSDRKLTLV